MLGHTSAVQLAAESKASPRAQRQNKKSGEPASQPQAAG